MTYLCDNINYLIYNRAYSLNRVINRALYREIILPPIPLGCPLGVYSAYSTVHTVQCILHIPYDLYILYICCVAPGGIGIAPHFCMYSPCRDIVWAPQGNRQGNLIALQGPIQYYFSNSNTFLIKICCFSSFDIEYCLLSSVRSIFVATLVQHCKQLFNMLSVV